MPVFHLRNMQNDYHDLVQTIIEDGDAVDARGGKTREWLNAQLVFNLSTSCNMLPTDIGRNINSKFAAVETLQVLAGVCEPEMLAQASPAYHKVLVNADPAAIRYAAYGPRLLLQFDDVITLLTSIDAASRQAVMTVWNKDDLDYAFDKPCTLTLQFLIRGGQLHMTTNMRSNDVWLGLGYDAFVFSQIQWSMLNQINAYLDDHSQYSIGTYTHNAASLHLYERDIATAVNETHHVGCGSKPPVNTVQPTGIHIPDDSELTIQDIAYDLLYGTADGDIVACNQWYAEQLQKMGIEQKCGCVDE